MRPPASSREKAVTDNTVKVFPGGVVSRDQQAALRQFERILMAAVQDAKDAGVPQGFIVAVLHGHATQQTNMMIEAAT